MVLVRCYSLSMSIILKNPSGCLFIVEYSYFYLQSNDEDPISVFASAVMEYQTSGTQTSVCKALKKAIKHCGNDSNKLKKAIIDIILDARMCKYSQMPFHWLTSKLQQRNYSKQQSSTVLSIKTHQLHVYMYNPMPIN